MKFLKFAIFVSFALAVGSLAGNWFLLQHLRREAAFREELETKNIQLEQKSNALQSQVTQLEDAEDRFRSQIKDYVNQRETIKRELEQVQQDKVNLQKRIQDLETEKEELAQQVDVGQVTDEAIVEEANKLVPLEPSRFDPRSMTGAPVGSPENPLEAGPALKMAPKTKTPQETAEAAPSPAAADQRPDQVLSVNRKFNFVVVNLGLRNRLKIGDRLRVEQKGKLVGRVQVEKLYENFSACTILEEIKPSQIQEGDLVRLV